MASLRSTWMVYLRSEAAKLVLDVSLEIAKAVGWLDRQGTWVVAHQCLLSYRVLSLACSLLGNKV